MNCTQVQQELLEFTGQPLPASLSDHLAECDECAAQWVELSSLAEMFAGEPFELSELESERLLIRVEDEITLRTDRRSENQAFSIRYLIPVAATILLLLGIQRMQPEDLSDVASITEVTTDLDYYEPEESMVTELLSEFTSYGMADPSATLLGDLTEEEMAYLNDNFDVGDIL